MCKKRERHLSTDDTPKTVSDKNYRTGASLRGISQTVQVIQQAFCVISDPDLRVWRQEVCDFRIVSPCNDPSIRDVLGEQVVRPEYFVFRPGRVSTSALAMYEADTVCHESWVQHHREEGILYNSMIRLPNRFSSGIIFERGSHLLNLTPVVLS